MYCPRCGQQNDDQAQFCRSCGASLQQPGEEPGAQLVLTEKRILGGAGLIGGILALVGIFAPWVTFSGLTSSLNISAWDLITRATVETEQLPRTCACLAFAGAVLVLLEALSVLAAPKAKALWGLLTLGGLLAIAGSAWGFSDIETGPALGMSVNYGYGLYLTMIGGILGAIGVLGFRS
jgi:hypothetical protein